MTNASTTSKACENCERTPAEHFKFQKCTGMIFASRTSTIEADLCKECALRAGRELQSSTLLTGWWGIFSFFRNIGAVFTNASGLSRAGNMRMPQSGELSFVRSPPVMARPQSWLGLAAIGGLIAFGVVAANATPSENNVPSYNNTPSNNRSTPAQASWSVGSCVSGYGSLEPVPCSQPHSGRITQAAAYEAACPATTEWYVDHDGGVLCIDTDG